ncbi:MAG: RluA family pseudouridine synthase [Patescibacteria group bacterium]|nr:RluA family pseudouridine synthase [Patescibacteria group bacterium]
MEIKYTVEKNGERLDIYLRLQLPGYSRSWIQKQIIAGQVSVNGKDASPHQQLRSGDVVAGEIISPPEIDLTPDPAISWETVFESPDYLVINKPAGLVVHPSEATKSKTLVNGLISRYPQIIKVGDDPLRPGIVHRLDKEVSGLMIVALTQETFEHFKKLFQAHAVKKSYTALVYGAGLPDSGTINFLLQRSKDGKIVSVSETAPGTKPAKWAETEYEVIERFSKYTLVKVTTLTGRTHQIRAHFHGLGHPLVGDNLYQIKRFIRLKHWTSLFLCADHLALVDPAGQEKKFFIDLPPQLKEIITELRQG